jgi:hypothetical protein
MSVVEVVRGMRKGEEGGRRRRREELWDRTRNKHDH